MILIKLIIFSINYSKKIILMNRSYSHSFRPTASRSKKELLNKSSTSFGFRTVWKSRDTHTACNKPKSNIVVGKQTLSLAEQQQNVKNYETAAQQEMKEFIKLMKNQKIQEPQKVKPPIQQTRTLQSSRSSRSVHSVVRSRCDSRSVFQFGENNSQNTLDQLEKKIQMLIQIRLTRKSQTRIFFNTKILQDDLDKQLSILIKHVRQYRNGKDAPTNQNQIDQQIKQISQKICIIQKAIAESATESQLLRKFYSSKKKNRKQYAVLDNKNAKLNQLDNKNQTFTSPRNASPFLHFQTTNMSTFTKPTRNSYTKQDIRNTSYLANRQLLPRSNYQRQFLYYGIVPTYSYDKSKSNLMTVSQTFNIIQNKPTTYQVQFKQKKSNWIDSRTLDCRQDKLKNLNINFMPSKLKDDKNAIPTFKKQGKHTKHYLCLQNKQNNQSRLPNGVREDRKSTSNLSYKHPQSQLWQLRYNPNMETQHSSKFQGQKCTIQTFMKQKGLSNLKYSYKIQFQS